MGAADRPATHAAAAVVASASSWPSDDLPCCGWRDLDLVRPLRPGEVTLLDHDGHRAAEAVYAYLADVGVLGRVALVADGANFLDVYRLARAGRRRAAARLGPDATRRALAEHEEIVLDRVRVARAFTAHQLQAIVEDDLPAQAEAAEARGEAAGLVCAPGLMDMYLDEELSRQEARVLAGRALRAIKRLARRLGVPALVVNWHIPPGSRHPMRALLEGACDEHVVVRGAPSGGVGVQLPRRGVSFLLPGPGRTRLDDFFDLSGSIPAAPVLQGWQRPAPWHPTFGRFKRHHHARMAWAPPAGTAEVA